ncbi:hypothetical protein [Hugenholtzia roseola]|uniref:hypothetical protein n=1 Tax=Hugenholtzia roseola TaxID=1002 RepID=UPI000425B41F|nr:hypothetical protein [Hugenholtzia roseola]
MKKYAQILPKKFTFLLATLFLLFTNSCDKPPLEIVQDQGSAYLPLELGRYVTYQIDQTVYELNREPYQVSFQLKEVVAESFQTEGGLPAFRIFRYKRPNSFENFQLDSVWVVRKEPQAIVRVEHNQAYVKLRFPVSENKTWDGNVFNPFPTKNYRLVRIGEAFSKRGQNFNPTLTLIESADSSLLFKDDRYEVYAQEIGRVYKRTETLIYCNDPESNCFGQKIIERGMIAEEIAIDFGIE